MDRLATAAFLDLPSGSDGKEPTCSVEDPGLIPGLGRSPGEGNGDPLQCSCLENSMDRRVWWATVHEVAKSQTWLSDSFTTVSICYSCSLIKLKHFFSFILCLLPSQPAGFRVSRPAGGLWGVWVLLSAFLTPVLSSFQPLIDADKPGSPGPEEVADPWRGWEWGRARGAEAHPPCRPYSESCPPPEASAGLQQTLCKDSFPR